MKEIDVDKQTKETLEFVFSETNKMATNVLKSVSENINKSYILFAFLSSLFSFCFVKIVGNEFIYGILLFGSLICIILIRKNLFPPIINFTGSKPEKLITSYFEDFEGENLEKEYLASQIQSYSKSIKVNEETIKKMVSRFKNTLMALAITFFLFGLIYVFISFNFFAESLMT